MKKVFFAFAILTILADISLAQEWVQTNGPGGDQISSIAVNAKGHIFIASRALHRSTDGGITWTQLFTNSPLSSIRKVFAQPSGAIIALLDYPVNYPDTVSSGIYRSVDNGNTWKLLIARTVLWQGSNGDLFTLDSASLDHSTNDGDSWVKRSLSGIEGNFSQVTSNKFGDLFLFAGYIYHSTDNGISWGKLINGLPTSDGVTNIWVSPNGEIFATKNYDAGDAKIFRSVDKGRTWNIDSNAQSYVTEISFNDIGGVVIGGWSQSILFSPDFGKTWHFKDFSIEGIDVNRIQGISPEPSGSFLLGGNNGLCRFVLSDSSIHDLSIPNGSVTAIVAHPNDNIASFNIYGNLGDGISGIGFLTSDQGNHWLNSGNFYYFYNTNSSVYSVAADSSGGLIGASYGYIINSKDSGKVWDRSLTRLTDGDITAIVTRFNGDIFAVSVRGYSKLQIMALLGIS